MLRNSPKSFINLIEHAIKLITPTNKDEINDTNINYFMTNSFKKQIKYKICVDNVCNIGLQKGKEQFDSVVNVLRTLQGMDKLEFSTDLCLDIPERMEDVGKREYITESLSRIESIGKYNELSFHYDIGVSNAILSVIFQVIDDSPFKGLRSKNLLNGNKEYVGISCKEVEGNTVAYLIFAESTEK